MKRLGRVVYSLLMGATAVACTSATPAQRHQWNASASREIVCQSPSECDAMWGRAIFWITQNSHFRVQQQTDFIVATYGPDAQFPSFTVNRVPIGSGGARIVVDVRCGPSIFCPPNDLKQKAALVEYILAEP